MGRPPGSRDKTTRKSRGPTAAEKAAKKAAIEAAQRAAANTARSAFFQARSTDQNAEDDSEGQDDQGDAGVNTADADHGDESNGDAASDGARTDGARTGDSQPPIVADLDDDEQLVDEVGVGVMAVYLKAIHDRLKAEVGAGNPNGPQRASVNVWLLPLLKEDHVCWRLSAAMARMVCGKLGLKYGEPAYYRDVVIWLPDLRWGDDGLPPCPECHCRRVGPHMFRENHDGRRICGLTEHYFILSRRYKCYDCEDNAAKVKHVALAAAEAAGLTVEEMGPDNEEKAPPYTYMGWDANSLPHIPFGLGGRFPAFLTYHGGVDKVTAAPHGAQRAYDEGGRACAWVALCVRAHECVTQFGRPRRASLT